tara:strand:- start:11931 stop:12182 length:252 start_codon:yes stop_codon:yes gene_type:complete
MLVNKFSNLLKSKAGKYVISAILGLGLASLFRKVCDDYNCVIYRGSNYEDDIKGKIFKHNDSCYKYSIQPVTCNEKVKIVEFA